MVGLHIFGLYGSRLITRQTLVSWDAQFSQHQPAIVTTTVAITFMHAQPDMRLCHASRSNRHLGSTQAAQHVLVVAATNGHMVWAGQMLHALWPLGSLPDGVQPLAELCDALVQGSGRQGITAVPQMEAIDPLASGALVVPPQLLPGLIQPLVQVTAAAKPAYVICVT